MLPQGGSQSSQTGTTQHYNLDQLGNNSALWRTQLQCRVLKKQFFCGLISGQQPKAQNMHAQCSQRCIRMLKVDGAKKNNCALGVEPLA